MSDVSISHKVESGIKLVVGWVVEKLDVATLALSLSPSSTSNNVHARTSFVIATHRPGVLYAISIERFFHFHDGRAGNPSTRGRSRSGTPPPIEILR